MLTVTFADLRYRYRQFLIAVVGAGVVLAMALLLGGVSAGFGVEVHRTIAATGADRWLMTAKSQGRLTSVATFPEREVTGVAHQAGVTQTAGFVLVPQEGVVIGGINRTVSFVGVVPHRIGSPAPTSGRALAGRGEVVADPKSGARIGESFMVGSRRFHVVGLVSGRTLEGGMPSVYMTLRDAQLVVFGGRPLVSAYLTKGVPTQIPAGLMSLDGGNVAQDTLESLKGATSSISNLRDLMWAVAAIIVAALVYVSALQRVRDFAVFKALGSSSRVLFASLCLQSIFVTLIAAGFGAAISTPLKGIFQQPVSITADAYLVLPLVAILVGFISSLVALRTATRSDPVSAFGG
jgi:putative ABC transport system permease protein